MDKQDVIGFLKIMVLALAFFLIIGMIANCEDIITHVSVGRVNSQNIDPVVYIFRTEPATQPYLEDVGAPLLYFRSRELMLEGFTPENYELTITEQVTKRYIGDIDYVKKLNPLPDIEDGNSPELWTDMDKSNEIFSSTEIYGKSFVRNFDKLNDNIYVANTLIFPKKYIGSLSEIIEVRLVKFSFKYDGAPINEPEKLWNKFYIRERGLEQSVDIVPEKTKSTLQECLEILNSPMLILAPSDFLSEVNRLADHKRNLTDRIVYIETVEDISESTEGKDIIEKIRNRINFYYQEMNVVYVMLIGDWGVFPVRYNYEEVPQFVINKEYKYEQKYFPLDAYFYNFQDWDVDKNGRFGEQREIYMTPDVIGGRFTARNLEELRIYVDKVIDYETNRDVYGSKNKILTCATILYKDWDSAYFYEYTLDRYCQNQEITELHEYIQEVLPNNIMTSLVDDSPTIFFHTGHTGWSTMRIMDGQQTRRYSEPLLMGVTPEIGNLYRPDPVRSTSYISPDRIFSDLNSGKYFAILSGGCLAAAWDKNNPMWLKSGTDCMLEYFLKKEGCGAIVVMGSTRSPTIYSTGIILAYMKYMFDQYIYNFAQAFYLARTDNDLMFSSPPERIRFEFLGDPTLVANNDLYFHGPGVDDEENTPPIVDYYTDKNISILALIIAVIVSLIFCIPRKKDKL